jgi:cytochrome c-type biogenesis protein
MIESFHLWIYHLEQLATLWVDDQLQHLSLWSLLVVCSAGLLTSLSPCMLSMLPITVGYIGGYTDQRWKAVTQSAWFALGVAVTLTGLGLAAAILGRIYGQIGSVWPLLMGLVALAMGLNLLQILPLRFPKGFADLELSDRLPDSIKALLLGLTFGLVASPCSTPVLIALLGWVSTSGNPTVGSGLLLAYALGLVSPLVLAGIFTASIKKLLAVRRWSGWVTYASGALLVGFGSLSILNWLV